MKPPGPIPGTPQVIPPTPESIPVTPESIPVPPEVIPGCLLPPEPLKLPPSMLGAGIYTIPEAPVPRSSHDNNEQQPSSFQERPLRRSRSAP